MNKLKIQIIRANFPWNGYPENVHTAQDLSNALADVKDGSSMLTRKYGILPSILKTTYQGSLRRSVGPTVLTAAEERGIVQTCITLADMGFGVTRELVAKIVRDYVQENGIANPFTDGVPGRDWWLWFLKRCPSTTAV